MVVGWRGSVGGGRSRCRPEGELSGGWAGLARGWDASETGPDLVAWL